MNEHDRRAIADLLHTYLIPSWEFQAAFRGRDSELRPKRLLSRHELGEIRGHDEGLFCADQWALVIGCSDCAPPLLGAI